MGCTTTQITAVGPDARHLENQLPGAEQPVLFYKRRGGAKKKPIKRRFGWLWRSPLKRVCRGGRWVEPKWAVARWTDGNGEYERKPSKQPPPATFALLF